MFQSELSMTGSNVSCSDISAFVNTNIGKSKITPLSNVYAIVDAALTLQMMSMSSDKKN